jgi:RNA ligase (TIGR02306 family)
MEEKKKRALARIAQVDSVEPIEGADRIEVTHIKGWKVVTGKGEFKPGDLVVYFEIDSALDPNDKRYEFLRERCLRKFTAKSGEVLKECLRIRTIRLRGVYSQGLVMPLDKFPEITDNIVYNEAVGHDVYVGRNPEVVGQDVTDILHVEHYDELVEALRPQTGATLAGDAMSLFPSNHIPKTDEERIQNLPEYFETMKDRKFQVTVKADGSSVTMFYSPEIDPENPFGVCSRNLRLKQQKSNGEMPLPWMMAQKYFVENKLKEYYENKGKELAVQGELVGPGIQSNRDMITDHEWQVFRIWNITDQKFLTPEDAEILCTAWALPHVSVLASEMPVFQKFKDIDEILQFAEGKTSRGNEREGLVFKSNDDGPYVSFKAVSNRYLMKEK